MDQHPHDLLPGFALGALDAAETLLVVTHIRDCPGCRDEVEVFRATVSVLPFTTPSREPPPHVKQQLLARISATQGPVAATHATAVQRPGPAASPWTRWSSALAALALLLLIALGAFTINTRRELATAQQQIAELQNQLQQSRQLAEANEAQLIAFMSDSTTVSRPLQPSTTNVTGRMYMQPGDHRAVIMVHGLAAADHGQMYRCWLATTGNPISVCSFTQTSDGNVEVMFDAPEPIDKYQQIMLTLEPVDSTHPNTDDVVLQAPIS